MAADGNKPGRVFSAYGSLDKKARHWKYLPGVERSCGESPRGEELVYRINETTLEVGQGASTFRGYIGLGGFVAGSAGLFIGSLFVPNSLNTKFTATVVVDLLAFLVISVISATCLLFVFWNDFFGYIDAPLRFDRIRKKVYIWASRKEGPLVLDWDQIRPVAQSVAAPPYQVNSFRSVLLVDEDQNGEVAFESRLPRIAQIGAAVLNREHTLAAYEFVRLFMERGPQALPSVKEHLTWRVGPRSFVDTFGLIKSTIRDWPQRPKHERSVGLLIFGIAAMTLTSAVFWPFQLAQGIALRTTRIPVWPDAYERMAAEGGLLAPPPGSGPNDPPMRLHEKLVAALWLGSAMIVYALIAWKVLG